MGWTAASASLTFAWWTISTILPRPKNYHTKAGAMLQPGCASAGELQRMLHNLVGMIIDTEWMVFKLGDPVVAVEGAHGLGKVIEDRGSILGVRTYRVRWAASGTLYMPADTSARRPPTISTPPTRCPVSKGASRGPRYPRTQ